MTRLQQILSIIMLDMTIILFSAVLSVYFLYPYVTFSPSQILLSVLLSSLMYLLIAYVFNFFTKMNRFTSLKEVLMLSLGMLISFTLSGSFIVVTFTDMSIRYNSLHFFFSCMGIVASRVAIRAFFEYRYKARNGTDSDKHVRTLLVGAGKGGNLFLKNLSNHFNKLDIIGIVDDDCRKHGFSLYGVKVLGSLSDIPYLVEAHRIEQVTVAIPSLAPERVEEIVDLCNQVNVSFNQMPSLEEFLQGSLPSSPLRDINVSDLLGREEVSLDMKQISESVKGKTILVSGAGGSIGSEIVRQLSPFSPKTILLLGHGENSIYHIHREMKQKGKKETTYIPLIADVQDRKRMEEVMRDYRPDFVFHAAAHKHVPLMENNPHEALKNNIYGTKNIAEAAKLYDVKRFVMVSSDKAVNPTNVMGASKRVAEMIVTGLNESGRTEFSAVRFGNVLGSRGSVVPLFQEQIQKGGPVTVTDFRMTRYFMTIPEASRLVIQAGMLASGGEIFVLDMGNPVKIVDLAKKIVKLSGYSEKDIPILETGKRPGEKLYEELLIKGERTERKVFDKIFVGHCECVPLSVIYKELSTWESLPAEQLKRRMLTYTNEAPLPLKEEQKVKITESEEPVKQFTLRRGMVRI